MSDSSYIPPLEKGSWKSIEEQRAFFGQMIGMDGPVPEHILLIALENEDYARQLLASVNAPVWREYLLKHPPKTEIESGAGPATSTDRSTQSNVKLVAKAGKALLRWGRTGFTKASPDLLHRREQACLHCPHLRPPNSSLEKLATQYEFKDELGERLGNLVCGSCGCGVRNKIRLPTEFCPEPHPTQEGYTRWGEEKIG